MMVWRGSKMDQSTRSDEMTAEARVPAARLADFAARAFVAAGLPKADAQAVAALMVEADLRGSDTHGVIRLPLYVRRLRGGGINAKPNIRLVSDSCVGGADRRRQRHGPSGDAARSGIG